MELTREIVLAEPPGKRLDSWIAEKVMGWRKRLSNGFEYWDGEGDKPWVDNWSPSADISAAFDVWEHDHPDAWELHLSKIGKKYLARIFERRFNDVPSHKELAQVESESAAEAMVKCRLLALMGEGEIHD